MLGTTTRPDQTHLHGQLSARDALAFNLRRWGMWFTVYGDGKNNGTYSLHYGKSSTNISDNHNWIRIEELFNVGDNGAENTPFFNVPIQGHIFSMSNATDKSNIDFWKFKRIETFAFVSGTFAGIGVDHYPVKTVLSGLLEITGIKSDGSKAVLVHRKGILRRDGSGKWHVDSQEPLYTSDALIISNAQLKVNGSSPGIEFNTGPNSSNFEVIRTLKVTRLTY